MSINLYNAKFYRSYIVTIVVCWLWNARELSFPEICQCWIKGKQTKDYPP